MAAAVAKVSGSNVLICSNGVVSIRIKSIDVGLTKWKEGTVEILDKDNKANLCIRYSSGGSPKVFQLNQNIKKVNLCTTRLMVTFKDYSVITLENVPQPVGQRMKECLEKIRQGASTALKTSQGSASFSILANRSVKKEVSPSGDRQSTPRRQSVDREDTTPRKPLGSPSRVTTSTPARPGLSETRNEKRKRLHNSDSDLDDYPKENDSSSNNKAAPDPSRKFLQSCKDKTDKLKQAEENRSSVSLTPTPLQTTSSFYGSRSVTKDYNSCQDRPASSTQTPSAKRSLLLPHHSTPAKKVRPSVDYGGWNRPRPSTLAQSTLQGFSNLGNTCYMNAILQSLFSLPSFSSDLLKQGFHWKKLPVNALLRRFSHLLSKKDTACPEMKKELLRRVKSAISATAERFSGYMQNDAHEFLSQCLDQLKEDVEKINKSSKSESPVAAGREEAAARPGDESDTSRIYTCPVVVNMEFEVQHTIICKCCGEVVTKREQFNDLSIDLPRRKKSLPHRSIQDSLDLFFRMEEIEYSCEKCNSKAATVTHKFSRLPRVLIVHLKRYSFNAQLSLNSKLGDQVMIPRYLTLLAHCTDATRPPHALGWSVHTTTSRTLKASQSLNSSSSLLRRGGVKGGSCSSILLDSDGEEEQLTRKVASRRPDDDRPDEIQRSSNEAVDLNEMNDDEMLAAVLELSRHDAEPPSRHDADPPVGPPSRQDAGLVAGTPLDDGGACSPDTGFGDTDAPEITFHTELLEPDNRQSTDVLNSLDLTMDENKENETPSGVQGELEWVQQYSLDQEREEQELQQALAQSLQEHEAQEMREDDDLKRATELSLQEFNNCSPELACSDEDSGNEELLDMEYSEAEAESLKRNAESGDLANSFRLISVVSHIGNSSSSGHYISDVYDMRKQSWLTYNDLDVSRTQETTVQRDRDRSGYIFFYMHKDVFEELSDLEKSGGSVSDAGRSVLQPL